MPTPIRHQAPTSGSDQSHCGSYVTRRTRGALRVAQGMTGGHDWRARTRGHGLGARTRGHALEPDGFHAVAPSGSHGARSPGAQRLARPARPGVAPGATLPERAGMAAIRADTPLLSACSPRRGHRQRWIPPSTGLTLRLTPDEKSTGDACGWRCGGSPK